MKPIRLLLIEDDPNLAFILKETLELQGYNVTRCSDGLEGYAVFAKEKFALILLDVMLPKKDGFTLAREIRQKDTDTPIIFLTAKSLKEDRIEGFRTGADDYVTKPFSVEELVLRIQAVLKRSLIPQALGSQNGPYKIGAFSFDPQSQVLKMKNSRQKLTHKEAELLCLLYQHKGGILEREKALKSIWGDDSFFNSRSMDVYISKLRKYLKKDASIEILNIHSRGYRLIVQ